MFQLLEEDILYKQVISTTGGDYDNGVWVAGDEIISYDPIEGIVEPYLRSEQSEVLPEGVSNTDTIILFSPDILKTHQSLRGSSQLADIILLEDPVVNPEAPSYTVWDRMVWNRNKGFALIEDYEEYILIREDRV